MRRRLVPALLALALLPPSVGAAPASPVPLPDAKKEEAAETLLSIDLEDGEAEVFIGGSWKGSLVGSGGVAFGSAGAALAETETPLLFAQEIDLTLSAVIAERWFVEAAFLDDYDLNTYRAGYLGAEGETVRYVGIGNAGLDFPDFPYLDISGGTPSSFGAYAAFGSGPLSLHALLRYDAAVREEKVYVGTRERSRTDISPAKRLKGRAFVLPDQELDAAPTVYFEDAEDGTLAGSDGRKYREAEASEAAVSATLGIVELSAAPSGRVAVAYGKGGSSTPWESSLGGYAGSGFLAETQAAFDASGQTIDLSAYPQPGGASAPGAITIGGTDALVVFDSGAFSPFELANRYAPPSAAASDSSAALVYASSGAAVSGYELEESSSTSFSVTVDEDGDATVSTTGRYFVLLSALSSADKRAPETRFPLAALEPSAYQPGAKGSATDIALRFTSYGSAGSYDIGTDVVAGSVVVFRGGVRDPLANYDASSGIVELSSAAGSGEIIRISYLKNAQDRRFGSLAAGIGAVYENEDGFSARTALALRWNVSADAFTTSAESSPGTVALSGSAAWDKKAFRAEASAALAYEAPDTTGLYRAVGMEDDETSIGMSLDAAESAHPPSAPAVPDADAAELFSAYGAVAADGPTAANAGTLAYRDYSATDVLGNSALKPIGWTGAAVDSSESGPYIVSATELDGKTAYVAEYALGAGEAEDGSFALWAGFQMELGSEAEILASARKLVVPYRFYDLAGSSPVRAYVQIGTLADEDGNAESEELVWSAPLGEAVDDGAGTETDWASPAFELSDLDRARLADARALRFVIRLDPSSVSADAAASGRLLVLPPVAQGAAFRPIVVSSGTVSAAGDEVEAAAAVDVSPTLAAAFPDEIERLHPDGESQRVLDLAWSGVDASSEAVGADGYPSPLPLWNYRTLSFYLRGPAPAPQAGSVLRVVVAESAAALAADGEADRFIDAEIPAEAFTAGAWSKIVLSYAADSPAVSVDGETVSGASVVYRPSLVRAYRNGSSAYGEREGPSYFALVLEAPEGSSPADGALSFDEICLEESVAGFGAYSSGALSWKREGEILAAGGRTLVSDLRAEARTELSAFGNPFDDASSAADGASVRGSGAVSAGLLGGNAAADLSAGLASGSFSWSASHRLELPFGPFALKESFAADSDAITVSRTDSLGFRGPVKLDASAALSSTETKTTRTWKAAASAGSEKTVGAKLGISAVYVSAAGASSEDSYPRSWIDSTAALVPDDGADAAKRQLAAESSLSVKGRQLGFSGGVSGGTLYSAALGTRARTAAANMAFPFALSRAEAEIAFYRTLSLGEETGGTAGGAGEDAASLGRALSDAADLFAAAPVWSLGADSLSESFSGAAAESYAASFIDGVSGTLKPKRAFGATSLFLPSSVRLGLERQLGRTLETETDALEATASLQFSSLNLFGAFGSAPRFDFYKSDEFSHSFSLSAEFPRGEDIEWEVGLRQTLAFYGFTSAKLSFAGTTRAGTEGWSHGSALVWVYPRERSLLKALYRASLRSASGWKNGPLFAELAATEAAAENRETLELAVSAADDVSWSWTAKHEALLRAAKKLTASVFASLGASGGEEDGETEDTTLVLSVGLTLSLRF